MRNLQASHFPVPIGTTKSDFLVQARIRGVKCDERAPACYRCTSTGRKCDGYRSAPRSAIIEDWHPSNHNNHSPIPSPERALSAFVASSKEKRSIGFFRDQVAPALSGSLDASFWNGVVLRLMHTEAAVRYAVMAVGMLFERFQADEMVFSNPRSPSGDGEHRFAIQCYNKAIHATRRQINEANSVGEVTLLTCILFICIEFLRGNAAEALSLCQQGSTMMRTPQASSSNSPLVNALSPSFPSAAIGEHYKHIFDRLKILSALFGKPQEDDPLSPKSGSITLSAPESAISVQSVAEARVALYALMDRSHKFLRIATSLKFGKGLDSSNSGALEAEKDGLLRALQRWRDDVAQLEAESDAWSLEANGCAVLQMYCSSTSIWVATALEVAESAHDGYLAEYQSMVQHATTLLAAHPSRNADDVKMASFTFEMGIIPPLYFTAIKCRHPRVRRAAVLLLRQFPRREGLWDAAESAAVAERVISLEEDRPGPGDEKEDDIRQWPDEPRRVQDAELGSKRWAIDGEGQGKHIVVDVEFRFRTQEGDWHITKELVHV